jgi:hypothetical protein
MAGGFSVPSEPKNWGQIPIKSLEKIGVRFQLNRLSSDLKTIGI